MLLKRILGISLGGKGGGGGVQTWQPHGCTLLDSASPKEVSQPPSIPIDQQFPHFEGRLSMAEMDSTSLTSNL